MENLKREIFVCQCGSLEHLYSFWYDEDYNEMWFEPHLVKQPWHLRIWFGIKYIFGYTTKYGDWDSVIIDVNDMEKLKKLFDKSIKLEKIRKKNV